MTRLTRIVEQLRGHTAGEWVALAVLFAFFAWLGFAAAREVISVVWTVAVHWADLIVHMIT